MRRRRNATPRGRLLRFALPCGILLLVPGRALAQAPDPDAPVASPQPHPMLLLTFPAAGPEPPGEPTPRPAPRARTAARIAGLAAAATAGYLVGAAAGGVLGWEIEARTVGCEYTCGAGPLAGVLVGGGVGAAAGAHLANGRRGQFLPTVVVGTTLGHGAAFGLSLLANDGDISVLTPLAPVVAVSLAVTLERTTARAARR
jgi:hypothetical protein